MRRHNVELFSDYFAQRDNVLTAVDARVKLLFVLALLVLVLINRNMLMFYAIVVAGTGALLAVGIPARSLVMRLTAPLFMAGVILLLQGVLSGGTPAYSFGVAGFQATAYREGIDKGLLIAGRVIAGTSLVVFLSMTTPMQKLLGALKYFRVPEEWLAVIAFTYRYIFVFLEEAQCIMDAQRLRLGYKGLTASLTSWGTLVGSLFARVYDQAQATHEAMSLRGYNGTVYIENPRMLNARDKSAALMMTALYLSVLIISFVWR